MTQQYRVWECKIAVPVDTELPDGFDGPPRRAAMDAVEAAGIGVVACFSGWAGRLSATQAAIVVSQQQTIYAEEQVDGKVVRVTYQSHREAAMADDTLRKAGGRVFGDQALNVALDRYHQGRCMFCGSPAPFKHIRCVYGTVNPDPYGQPPATVGPQHDLVDYPDGWPDHRDV